MRIIKLFFAIALGIISVWAFVFSIAQASSQTAGLQELTATIRYVDADAPGPMHNGNSWTTAYTTVQDALTVAINGTEIWVAEGIYYPDEGAGQINDWISSTFALSGGVALYGGFDPDSGIDEFAERDWETYVTVLSGDLDHNDTTDPHGVVTDTDALVGTNANHVVSNIHVATTALIDGFTITGGWSTGTYTTARGGGMYNLDSSPTLINLSFSGNQAPNGGGMYNYNSDPTLDNIIFAGNLSSFGAGGGMLNYYSNPSLNTVNFAGNDSENGGGGGGMANWDSSPVLNNVIFSDNSADLHIKSGVGGGMVNNPGSNPSLNNVLFLNNYTNGSGGGMYNYGNPVLTNVTFLNNDAFYGGGMHSRGNPTLNNVTFFGNSAFAWGGGMANYGNSTLTNVVFSGNEVDGSGGGMYNNGGPVLTNVTFSGNHAGSGGGIYNTTISTPTLSNTILWGNTSHISGTQIHNEAGSAVLIGYSDILGCGDSGTGWDPACGTDNGHNIDAEPLFLRNPDPGQDGIWDGIDDDYGDLHLRSGSPAIDTGTNNGCPATDLDGTPRPVNANCDMGAYEYLNLPPVAINDYGWSFATDKDLPFTTASVLANDWDPNDDPLTITDVDTSGALGLITDNGDGTFAYDPNGQFDYLAPGESATETFTYAISDGLGGSDTATVTLTITDYFYYYLPLIGK